MCLGKVTKQVQSLAASHCLRGGLGLSPTAPHPGREVAVPLSLASVLPLSQTSAYDQNDGCPPSVCAPSQNL